MELIFFFNIYFSMKKIIYRLLNVDKKTLIFLILISFMGLLTGSLFMTVLSNQDKQLINETIISFVSNIKFKNYIDLIQVLGLNIIQILFIWLLGISVIGIPFVIIFIFIKSFLLSFSMASFIANLGFKGLILSVIYNFPHNFVNLALFLYLSVYSIRLSIMLLNGVIRRKNINFKDIMNRYLLVLLASVIIMLFMSFIEVYIIPRGLKIIANVL